MYRQYESDGIKYQPMPDEFAVCLKSRPEDWETLLPIASGLLNSIINHEEVSLQLDKVIDTDKLFKDRDLRDINYQVMNVISAFIPNFIGGSADVVSSTKTYLKGKEDIL